MSVLRVSRRVRIASHHLGKLRLVFRIGFYATNGRCARHAPPCKDIVDPLAETGNPAVASGFEQQVHPDAEQIVGMLERWKRLPLLDDLPHIEGASDIR